MNVVTERRGNILIVEDDPETLAGLSALLEDEGYDVRTAATFNDARRALDAAAPDLLITDVRLGAYNGLQLVMRVRRHDADVPTLVLTGFSDTVTREQVERLGGIYMEKPVDADRLLTTLRSLLLPPPSAHA